MQDRRLGYRVPFEAMVTSYVHDRPIRGLTSNLCDTGMNMSSISMLAPPPGLVVGARARAAGRARSIWAAGRICYRNDDGLASGLGVRFVAMARSAGAPGPRLLHRDRAGRTSASILARIRA